MQISFQSQHVFNFPHRNCANPVQAQSKSSDKTEPIRLANYEHCSSLLCHLQSCSNLEKKYIKNIRKLIKDDTGNFSIQKAAKYIKQLTDEQLLLYSPEDINEAIAEVLYVNPTTTREEVLKTLAQLTSFSNYDSLNSIEKYCEKENITKIYQTQKLTVNNIFSYLANEKKSILKLAKGEENPKTALFVDRNTIEDLKELKEKNPDEFVQLKDNIINGETKLILLDGWEAITKKGKKSFNFVGAWGDLATAASSIIQEQSPKSVFNKDITENINTLFEKDMPVDIIQNMPDTIDENIIAQRLNPKTLNEEDIIKAIRASSAFTFESNADSIALEEIRDNKAKLENRSVNLGDKNLKKILKAHEEAEGRKMSLQEVLSLMFIYTCNVYSPRKMALEMKEMHKKLSERCFYYNKPESNMLFIVPQKDKSFGLVNYQYSKVNNIPLDNYIYTNKNDLIIKEQTGKNKVLVLFDDFSGSGHSMIWELLPYSRFRFLNKQPIIFAALTYIPKAKKMIEKEIDTLQGSRFIKDSFLGGKEIKTLDDLSDSIAHRKTNLITKCVNRGYSSGGSTIAFPYVIPDNCIDVSGLILENLLRNKLANKAKMNSYKHRLLMDTLQ